MSKFVCFIFRITSFAFLLLSLAFIFPQDWLPLVLVATLLMFLSLIIIIFAQKEATESAIRIETFDNIDDQAGWIITVYLFFMLTINIEELNIYIFALIVLLSIILFLGSKSFAVNPVLRFFGFHFYKITVKEGGTYLLISRNVLKNNKQPIPVGIISDYVYIEKRSRK